MCDFAQMHIVDCFQHLLEDESGVFLTEAARFLESAEEFTSFAEAK